MEAFAGSFVDAGLALLEFGLDKVIWAIVHSPGVIVVVIISQALRVPVELLSRIPYIGIVGRGLHRALDWFADLMEMAVGFGLRNRSIAHFVAEFLNLPSRS